MVASGAFQRLPLGSVGDSVVIQSHTRAFPGLDGFSYVAHQRVEYLGPVHQTYRKDQLFVLVAIHLNRDLVLRKHIAGAEPQLEGVSKVDGNGEVSHEPGPDCGRNGGLGGEDPGRTGKVDCNGVDIDSRNGEP